MPAASPPAGTNSSARAVLTRDAQPKAPLGTAGVEVGKIHRAVTPQATSALVDITGLVRVCAVFAGDDEIDTADDTGPFDTETLGWADEVLRRAMDDAVPEGADSAAFL